MTMLLAALGRYDERMLHALVTRRVPWLDRVMCGVTHFGDASVVVVLTMGLQFSISARMRAAAHVAAFALCASHMLVQLVKRTISRERPRLPVGAASLMHAPDRFSFPSGHAAASLSVAIPLAAVLSVPAAAAILAIAALVGISRCYLGVHYPGDVLAGWMLGGGAVLLGALL